jgi:hypothetical protein
LNKKLGFVVMSDKKDSAYFFHEHFARIGRNSKKNLNFKIKTIKGIPTYYAK